ncbi:MAG: hypothetical protein AAB316_12470 [Bacteroidota bacterium]
MGKYKAIKGSFHVKGFAPDGDSLRFQAFNADNWNWAKFKWETKALKNAKKKQLRIEAIDALETHYEGARQPHSFAIAALEHMLELLGIKNVQYNLLTTEIIAAEDGVPGWILTGSVDAFGRPISLIFRDLPGFNDGDEVESANVPVELSLNYLMALQGIVYPTFYASMEPEMREKFKVAFATAKGRLQGLWAIDKTGGFRLWNIYTVQQDVIILPKLFRRFISFFKSRGDLAEFMDFMADNKDPVMVNGVKRFFHEFVEVEGNHYRLTVSPEELIFLPEG